MLKVLSKINEPKDLKGLTIDELNILAEEIREGLFNRLTKIGGHFYQIGESSAKLIEEKLGITPEKIMNFVKGKLID